MRVFGKLPLTSSGRGLGLGYWYGVAVEHDFRPVVGSSTRSTTVCGVELVTLRSDAIVQFWVNCKSSFRKTHLTAASSRTGTLVQGTTPLISPQRNEIRTQLETNPFEGEVWPVALS